MHAAGSLADSCSVRRIAALHELPLAGDDAQACTLTPNPTLTRTLTLNPNPTLILTLTLTLPLPLPLPLAQGGAGHKAVLTLEYDGPTEALAEPP